VIAQTLHRDFVLAVMEELEVQLEDAIQGDDDDRRGGLDHPANEVGEDDWKTALKDVRAARAHWSDGQPAASPPVANAKDEPSVPLDDFAFIPRDAILSVVQAAVDEHLETRHPELIAEDDPPDDRRGPDGETMVTNRYLKDFQPELTPEGRRWFGPFETVKPWLFGSDPLWLTAGVATAIRAFRHRHDFNETPAEVDDLDEHARLVMCSDWATGIPRALKVRDLMRTKIEEAQAEGREIHVLHLGDVYYAGFKREYEKRFLEPWPVYLGDTDTRSWVLSGNHDMYAGGYGFFDTCLADPRFASQDGSSWFRLSNKNWHFVGLDTAWRDGGLQEPQGARVAEWAGDRHRKLVLLSHHQLFSAYGRDYGDVGKELHDVLKPDDPIIEAWFWGHEHGCVGYKPHMGVRRARLIGNGGVPEYMNRKPRDEVKAPAEWEFRKRKRKLLQPWNTFGFVVIDLDGPSMEVTYIDEDGEPMHEAETIE
jgi:hypothetical protein